MSVKPSQVPRFHPTQRVRFLGGEGIVQSYRFEAETWMYLIEMALGAEPNCGRVGGETTVVLTEADLRAV